MRYPKLLVAETYVVLLVTCLGTCLFAQTTEWLRTGSSTGTSAALEIAADKGGSVYAYGTFMGTITFGSLTLNAGAGQNHYLVKYTSDGTPVWAQKISGNPIGADVSGGYLQGTSANGLAITSDQKGGIYISGQFQGSVTIGTRTLTSPNYILFVAKLDTNGVVQWAIKGGANSSVPAGLAADSLGNIYLIGTWSSNNPFIFGPSSINFLGINDVFLVKIRQDSTVVWAKAIRQTDRYEVASSIATDKTGNVYLTGLFRTPAVDIPDAYLAKLDSSGTVLWQQFVGAQNATDYGLGVTVVPNGSVYFVGTCNRGGNFQFDTLSLSSRTQQARFIAKFTNTGKIVWVWIENPWTETFESYAPPNGCVTSDMAGSIYYGGAFRDSMKLGPFRFKTNNGLYDAIVAGLSPSNIFLWAKQGEIRNRRSQVYAMSATPYGDIYACGAFEDSVKFDSTNGFGTGLNAFVVKITTSWIFTSKIQGSPFCAGFIVEVPFTTKGNFPENTTYYLQLSDSSGNFGNALTIDSLVGTNPSLFLSRIPIDMPAGTRYRFRVISKAPDFVGFDNGTDLRIIAAPKITFDPPSPIRVCDLSTPVSVTATASGSTVFNWRDGVTGATRTFDKAGWYYLTVENEFTCERLDSIEVIDLPPVEATITPSRILPVCEGSTVDLTAGGGLLFSWSTGDTSKMITVASPGEYRVTVTDSYGCSDTTSILVTTKPGPKISISLEEIFFMCPGDSVVVTASEASNYLWSTGDTTRSITITYPGFYSVSTADSNCRGYSKTLAVKFHSSPAKPNITRKGDTLITTAPPQLQWFFNGIPITGATTQTIVAIVEGIYTVRTTDSNGCNAFSNGFPFSFSGVKAKDESGIQIHPNPAEDRLTVTVPKAGIYSIALYDMLGRTKTDLFNGYTKGPAIDIPLPQAIDAGSYILRVIINRSEVRSFMIVKE